MRILVFGAGAVGQAVGCMLAADGHTVDLVVRERFIDAITSNGLTVHGIFGEYHAGPDIIGAFPSADNLLNENYAYALITTKSYDTVSATVELSKIASKDFFVVSLQNGCGNLETVVESFGEERSLGGRVITGFEIEKPGLIKITVTADDIHIGGYREGEIPQAAKTIADAVNNAGLPCTATKYIKRDLFAKLLYNCSLNPLGAALGVHYGALGDDPGAREIMNAVIREVFAVLEAVGEKTHWDSAEDYQSFFYGKQIPATYNHRSSMLQDIEKGKRTEVDALTGYVSLQGRKNNVATPVCDTLSEIIRFKERNREE